MPGGAQLSVTDLRRATRYSVQLPVIAEHRMLGDLMFSITNVSSTGFMASGIPALGKGERVTIRLPQIGRIEAFLVWGDKDRAGFQFERVIRADDLVKMVKSLVPRERPAR
jgi:hypothetical protein